MRYVILLTSLCLGLAYADDPAVQPVPPSPGKAEAAAKVETVVMARVGPTTITVEEFMNFLVKNAQYVEQARTTKGKALLLRNAIENRLLMLEMRDEALLGEGEPGTDDKLQLAVAKLEAEHFPPPPAPDEAELLSYYEAHKELFGIPASARVSQIQIRVAESATDEEKTSARKRAEAALKRIDGGESFGDVAAEVSDRPGARATKGDLGYLKRNVDPWFDHAIEGLEIGQHTGVLESASGYDILLLTDKREAIITPFPEARDAVARAITAQKQAGVRAAYVKSLAKKYGVTVELDELKGAYPNGVFP